MGTVEPRNLRNSCTALEPAYIDRTVQASRRGIFCPGVRAD